MKIWRISDRILEIDRPVVMGILNVTPDSFSDGGLHSTVDNALRRVEKMVRDGADVIDVGGESTRPGGKRVSVEDEVRRTEPFITAIRSRFSVPVSIDTTRFETATAALDAGANIINDISGLRFDERLAELAAGSGCGLILMHSLGSFETMHSHGRVDDIVAEVTSDFRRAIATADEYGVGGDQLVLDVGLGFGKTFEQNLELIAKLGKIADEFSVYPLLVGASRKSFIGKVLNEADPSRRLGGSLCAAIESIQKGAAIIRVHDVKESVDALSMLRAIKDFE
jgi:dihydropteroate synthase